MKYLRDQIDKMRKPNESTRAMAKAQAGVLVNAGRYSWVASEVHGEIQFRRVTPASTALVTVEVIEV